MHKGPVMLAALMTAAAWGQAPTYTAAGIVNVSDYGAGPFAPNSALALFGANLAWSTRSLAADDIVNNTLPTALNGVSVYVDNWPAALLYVSPEQINFIVPGGQSVGSWAVRVVREGVTGPEITITLMAGAPALFAAAGYAIATHVDGSGLTPEAPAHAGEVVVIYATGLGKTQPNPAPGTIPLVAAPIAELDTLEVYIDGVAADPASIKYAGVTPFCAGLYQINVALPAGAAADPEIRVMIGAQESLAGLKLVVR
jgi:uncharacterized protein (TIGR03437 family)